MERIDLSSSAHTYKRMVALDQSIDLDRSLRHLVKLRVSQINGCAYCIELHSREAADDGEPPHRLHGLAAWWEVDWYTDEERAALALAEALTRLPDHGVTDEVVDEAREQLGEEGLVQLVWAITAINAWNRIAVAQHKTPESPA